MCHGKADVRCCCLGPGTKRLSIHSRASSDRFHLARFPASGPEHSEDCSYYSTDPAMSGLGNYRKGVVQELDDGSVKVKLKVGLQQKATKAPQDAGDSLVEQKKQAPSSRSGQSSMSLLGLLHYLWTEAGFNSWPPSMEGKRTLGVLHYHLLRIAKATYAGRLRLASSLLVSTATASGGQAELNKAKAVEAMNRRRRLVVVAPLFGYQVGMEGVPGLPISGYHGIPHLMMSPGQWEVLHHKFAREVNGWMSGSQVVVIAQTDVPVPAAGAMKADVVDLGLVLVTPEWIPVDSGYESAVVAKFVASGRRFEKPLRFDAGSEQVFPDFWLHDRSDLVPMEVWGLSDPEYLARKATKIAHYDETYGEGGWWQWDADAGDSIPPFP
ncbi:DUF1173 family protein [Bordetella genomosp. 5]